MGVQSEKRSTAAAEAAARAEAPVAVMVTVRWGDAVVASRRVARHGDAILGAAPGAVAAIPCEPLGCEAFAVASVRRGRAVAHVPAGCVASLSTEDSHRLVAGPAEIPLADGATVTLWLAGFHVAVAATDERRLPWAPAPWRAGAYGPLPHIALAALAHAVAFGLAAQSAYASEILGDDGGPAQAEQMRHYLAAVEVRAEAPDPVRVSNQGAGEGMLLDGRRGNGEAGGGARAAGEEGKMGSALSRRAEPRRFALPGAGGAPPELTDRAGLLADAWQLASLGRLAPDRQQAPDAGFGALAARGPDAIAADGAMWARAIGDAAGSGGLGLTGTGIGGGGEGEGVGLLTIGTIGHGGGPVGDGTGGDGTEASGIGLRGWWSGTWDGGIGRRGYGVGYRYGYGGYGVQGRLPPEAIQRVVRQNFGRFRRCYENGLVANPALAGRVATRFLIGRDGAVHQAANAGSDMPDANVTSCVVRAFYGLSFPAPPGGTVTVVYPITFSPTG